MSSLIVLRFAAAILFDAAAFIVWDIGTRPPLQLGRDLGGALRSPWVAARGVLRFGVGLALLVLGARLALPALPTLRSFTLLETGMLIAALLVENLVGPDLRRRLAPRA